MWIMLFTLWAGSGVATSSTEFASKETCVAAAEAYKEKTNKGLNVVYVLCVKK